MPTDLDPVLTEQVFAVNRKRTEVVIYYRHPERWPDQRNPRGRKNDRAGWITWGDSQPEKRLSMLARGFEPLNLRDRSGAPVRLWDADPAFDRYGPWGPILVHPLGPQQFPVSQLLSMRWYDPDQCPVPGTRFPQLAEWVRNGGSITEYVCPECNDRTFAKPEHLARHLRNTHTYTREDIVALGKEMGVDFTRELAGSGTIRRTYELAPEELAPPVEEPAVPVQAVRPKGRAA